MTLRSTSCTYWGITSKRTHVLYYRYHLNFIRRFQADWKINYPVHTLQVWSQFIKNIKNGTLNRGDGRGPETEWMTARTEEWKYCTWEKESAFIKDSCSGRSLQATHTHTHTHTRFSSNYTTKTIQVYV